MCDACDVCFGAELPRLAILQGAQRRHVCTWCLACFGKEPYIIDVGQEQHDEAEPWEDPISEFSSDEGAVFQAASPVQLASSTGARGDELPASRTAAYQSMPRKRQLAARANDADVRAAVGSGGRRAQCRGQKLQKTKRIPRPEGGILFTSLSPPLAPFLLSFSPCMHLPAPPLPLSLSLHPLVR